MKRQLLSNRRWPRAIRLVIALTLTAVSAAFAPSGAAAQSITSYNDYLMRLTGFETRGANLIKEISDVGVIPKYCDDAQRRADGRRLAELFIALSELRRDWGDFKASVNKFATTPVGIGAFGAEKQNPNDPHFWAKADRAVVEHAQADLDALRERFRASKTIDCNAPHTTRPPTSPPPAASKIDPLAGLTRPPHFTQTVPPIPKPFCSDEERWKYIMKVLRPLMDENSKASSAMREYRGKVTAREQAATAPGKVVDQSALDVLEKEDRWAGAEHERIDKIYAEIGKLVGWARSDEAVVDCTQKMTTPAPTPTGATGSPNGKPSGDKPPIPVDTTKPRTEPKANEPPRVGVLPGARHHEFSVFGGYEWNSFPSFPKVIGDAPGIADADGKSSTGGSYIGFGVRLVNWRFSMCRHVSVLRYSQLLDGIGGYEQVDGRLTGSLYDFSVGREMGLAWNTYVEWVGGYTIAYDKLEMNPLSNSGLRSLQERSLLSGKLNLGLSVRHPLTSTFDVEAGFGLHTSGRSGEDADFQRAYRIGARYGFHF